MKKIRASALNRARICPGSASIKTGDTEATLAGTAFHGWIADFVTAKTGDVPPDYEEALDYINDLGLIQADAVEEAYELQLEDWVVTGHVDAIYADNVAGEITVIDWKWSDRPERYGNIERDYQMLAYALMAWEYNNGYDVAVFRVFPKVQSMDSVPITIKSAEDAEKIRNQIGLVLELQDGEFYPGPHCQDCLAASNCETFLAGANNLLPMPGTLEITAQDAPRLAMAVDAAKKLTKAVEAALKLYVQEGGEINVGGKVWAPSDYETDQFTDGAAEALYAEYGASALRALKPAKTALKKVDKGAVEMLRGKGCVKKVARTKWAWRTAK